MGGVMTRDDIIHMAREAGFEIEKTLYGPVPCVDGRGIDDRLERFATLVAAEKDKEIKRLQDMLYEQLGELTALLAEKQMRERIKEIKEQPK